MKHSCKACGKILPESDFRVHKRGYRIGKCRECEREYQRQQSRLDPEKYRQRKRESMARRRAADPEKSRDYQNTWRAKNADRVNANLRQSVEKRLFWGRALRLRGVSSFDLWKMWKAQRGRCALSGRKLDRTAEIDHRIPKVRGGGDDLPNLQWVTKEANRAKRDLTEDEFQALCRDCADWIGERIAMVNSIMKAAE